jgi:hypothetical protein
MIIDNLNVFRAVIGPAEYDPPLVIDADRMRANAVALQGFESVAGRRREIAERACIIELHQLAPSDVGDRGREAFWYPPQVMHRLGELALEAPDHVALCIMA